jgi:CHAT domain-containing protein/murein DD-endopeptidase MepM/ murein hydrolase activator NlpD
MRRQRHHKISLRAGIVTGVLLLLFFADIICLNQFQSGGDLSHQATSSIVQGQRVLASADGLVVRAEKIDDLSQAVTIDHGFGLTTRYEHMVAADVHKGQRIKSGDVIGLAASGRSTGAELNFEVRVADHPVPLLASVSSRGTDEQFRQFATRYGQGDALLASNAVAALEEYREALRLSQGRGDSQEASTALYGISRAEKSLGRLYEAWNAVERALKLVESARGWQLADREIYALAIDLLMEKGKRESGRGFESKAFELSERARARALLDSVDNPREPRRALKCRDIRESLDSGTIILSYWLGDERSFLWVVGRDSIESWQLPPRQEIDAAATRAYLALRESNRRASRASWELAIQSLSRMIIGPVGEGVLGQKRLAIIPDGGLHNIPFAALSDPAGPGQPLIYRHEIVTSASASDLRSRKTKDRPAPANFLAVVADPVYDTEDPRSRGRTGGAQEGALEPDRARSVTALDRSPLPRLPFSRREAEHILSLASPRHNLAVMGFSANRGLLMSGILSNYRILHFATHRIADAEHSASSGIVLSLVDQLGRSQNGLLRESDIRNLRLFADLVVLSSCQTGRGSQIGEQSSLVRSFRDAGASRVIASLWNVDDRATAMLMTRFYEALLSKHLAPAAALREAQTSMLDDPQWSAPFYWAAFVLEGDWK